MNETVNQDATNDVEQQPAEQKTFTQEELNAIIDKRYARMMEKFADYDDLKAKAAKLDELEEASKSELQKATERAEKLEAELNGMKREAEVRAIRDEVATEMNIPSNLLTGSTKEECEAQAKNILEFAKPNTSYPTLKDSGEIQGAVKGNTKQQFAQWAEKAFN